MGHSMDSFDSSFDTKSTLVSRNITVWGKRTSVRLEPEMWGSLQEMARRESCKIHDICSLIQLRKNPNMSLTAAIRVFLMLYYRAASTEDGHRRAGHGNFMNMMNRARMTDDMLQSLTKTTRRTGELPCSASAEVACYEDMEPRRSSGSQA